MYYILFLTFFFTNFFLISLNFLNLFLCNLNYLKINIILILIYSYSLYFNNILWKFNIIVTLIFINITEKRYFILNNFYLGYYKIHPIFLYISLVILFIYFSNQKKYYNFFLSLVCFLVIVTFVLGSLWSLSQSIWSKYWSNDSIEIVLILFIIVGTYYLHVLYKFSCNFYLFTFIQILLLLILLRLNYIYTKHNFFQKVINSESFFYLYYIFNISYFLKKQETKKIINKLKQVNIILYIIIIEMFLNILNINIVKSLNNWIFYFILLYLVLLLNITVNLSFIHYLFFTILLIFNNYFLNFTKYNFLFLYNKKFNSLYYFFVKKDVNYYLFNINIYLNKKFNFYNNYNLLKNNSNHLKTKFTNINMINFF